MLLMILLMRTMKWKRWMMIEIGTGIQSSIQNHQNSILLLKIGYLYFTYLHIRFSTEGSEGVICTTTKEFFSKKKQKSQKNQKKKNQNQNQKENPNKKLSANIGHTLQSSVIFCSILFFQIHFYQTNLFLSNKSVYTIQTINLKDSSSILQTQQPHVLADVPETFFMAK